MSLSIERSRVVSGALLGFLLLLTGCAQYYPVPVGLEQQKLEEQQRDVAIHSSTVSADEHAVQIDPLGYECPTKPNAVPDLDLNLDGSGHFKLCGRPLELWSVKVEGHFKNDPRICAIPANTISRSQILIRKDSKTGLPLLQCATLPEGGDGSVQFLFQGVAYNSLFLMPATTAQDMVVCLATQNPYFCPRYSYGRFR